LDIRHSKNRVDNAREKPRACLQLKAILPKNRSESNAELAAPRQLAIPKSAIV
jgi:hypothetical protein